MDTLALRIEKLEREVEVLFSKVNAYAVSQATTLEKLGSVLETLAELKEGIRQLQAQPAKRFDSIVGAAISATLAALIGYFFGRL